MSQETPDTEVGKVKDEPDNIKTSFIKRYGFLGALVVLLPMVTPYIDKYLEKRMIASFQQVLSTELYYAHAIDNKIQDDTLITVIRLQLQKSANTSVLYIENTLSTLASSNNTDADTLKKQRTRMENLIKNELIRQRNNTLRFLNTFDHPALEKVGNHISAIDNYDAYIYDIFDIIWHSEDTYTIADIPHIIGDDIRQYLFLRQESIIENIQLTLEKESRSSLYNPVSF